MLTPKLARMVVGPEAAGSLLVGTVVKSSVDSGTAGEGDEEVNLTIFTPYDCLRAMETSSAHQFSPFVPEPQPPSSSPWLLQSSEN